MEILVCRARAGGAARRPCAADVHAVRVCAASRCKIASSCRRWRSTRAATACPTITTSCIWAAARTAARASCSPRWCACRADARISPGCAGPVRAGARRRHGGASSTTCTRGRGAKIALQLGHAGPKGSTQLGWEASDEPLAAGNWPLIAPSAIAYGPNNQVPRAMTRADMDRVASRVRARDALGCRCGLRLARTALRPRLSPFRVHLSADQSARRRVRRHAREPLPLSARSVSRDARRVARGQADVGAHLRARLGARRQHARRCRRHRANVQGGRRRPDRRVVGPDDARRQAGLRPHVPDAVRRSHPQRDGHRDDGRRRDLRARPREQHPDGRTRRPVRTGPAAPGRSLLDAARGGAAGLPRRRMAACNTAWAATSWSATSRAPRNGDRRPEANG